MECAARCVGCQSLNSRDVFNIGLPVGITFGGGFFSPIAAVTCPSAFTKVLQVRKRDFSTLLRCARNDNLSLLLWSHVEQTPIQYRGCRGVRCRRCAVCDEIQRLHPLHCLNKQRQCMPFNARCGLASRKTLSILQS